jgi:MtfA peptidase
MWRDVLRRWRGDDAQGIDEEIWAQTLATYPFLAALPAEERQRLRVLSLELLQRKEMDAAAGLVLSAPMQVAIAAQACLPVLNLGLHWYDGWTGIVVYPSAFVAAREHVDEAGVVHSGEQTMVGEAWEGGPLLLSWADVADAAPAARGTNVVIHEFTHKIDMLNGEADGLPPFDRRLHPGLEPQHWQRVFADAYERFCAELELIESELPADIDPDSEAADPYYARLPIDAYAAHDEGEFFAVSSEAFFVAPEPLAAAFPEWFEQLALFFRQDPLARGRA